MLEITILSKKVSFGGLSTTNMHFSKKFDLLSYSTDCGRVTGKIVGGYEASPYSLPWQVALVSRGGRRPFCGGTLLGPRHVLTAAHCMTGSFDIIVGEHDYTSSLDGTRHTVCGYVKHPSYSQNTMNSDFAMIHLDEPVQLGARATPACLPRLSWGGDHLAGKTMTVSGWGTQSAGGSQPKVLYSVDVPGITSTQCAEKYSGQVNVLRSMLCAGDVVQGRIDACQGDSGGKFCKALYAKRDLR